MAVLARAQMVAAVVVAAVAVTAALEDSRSMAAAFGVECYPRPPLDVQELKPQLPKHCQRRRPQSLRDVE